MSVGSRLRILAASESQSTPRLSAQATRLQHEQRHSNKWCVHRLHLRRNTYRSSRKWTNGDYVFVRPSPARAEVLRAQSSDNHPAWPKRIRTNTRPFPSQPTTKQHRHDPVPPNRALVQRRSATMPRGRDCCGIPTGMTHHQQAGMSHLPWSRLGRAWTCHPLMAWIEPQLTLFGKRCNKWKWRSQTVTMARTDRFSHTDSRNESQALQIPFLRSASLHSASTYLL